MNRNNLEAPVETAKGTRMKRQESVLAQAATPIPRHRRRPAAKKSPRPTRHAMASQPTRIQPTRVQPTPGTLSLPSFVIAWDRWLARDDDSSDLENFPFALTVSMILLTGIAAIGWGVIVSSAWATVLGILVALVGCVLYGWSLYEDRD